MLPFDKSNIPSKVYLSGADCFHLVLDRHSKKNKAGGNVMHKVFYFEKSLPIEIITQALQHSAILYWLCNIEMVYGSLWKIPYWKFTDQGTQIMLNSYPHNVEREIPGAILNRDIPINAKRFIEFSYVSYPSGTCAFVMSWNHILLDGKGTLMLLRHINNLFSGKPNEFEHFFPAKDKFPNIFGYISNMYKVKRFIQTSSKAPIASLANNAAPPSDGFQYKQLQFTAEETKQMDEIAFKKGARFGPNLFYLSCCMHSVNALLHTKKKDGTIWMPVPYDGRLRGAEGPIVSNCVSYMFYRVPAEQLASVEHTVTHLTGQMSEQIKIDIPKRYNRLLMMMRHLPLWLYYFLISRTGDGQFSSFLYSSAGNNFNDFHTLFGQSISGITVFPCPTYPPGLTFIFLRHRNTLNINFAYAPTALSMENVKELEQSLRRLLLQGL